MIKAGIIGAAGYVGGEMIRLLLRHPSANLYFAQSESQGGLPVAQVHTDLEGETDLCFSSEYYADADILFLCLGHGASRVWLEEHTSLPSTRIIDLSQDYRLAEEGKRPEYKGVPFVYGLPELNRELIRHAKYVANPGCFATAIQLGLLPLSAHDLLKEVYATGITGSTGAGQGLQATSHFSWRAGNIQAYKSLTHQHLREIEESLAATNPSGTAPAIHFIPWRGDFTRGIHVSQQLKCALPLEQLYTLYENYFAGHPFMHVSRKPIHLKQVVNTNRCLVHIEQEGTQVVVHSVIDNLLKGAAGQAMQNMNILYGLDEKTGLDLKASFF